MKPDSHDRDLVPSAEYRLLLDSIDVLFYTCDLTGRITFINRQAFSMLGYPPRECLGRYLWEFVPERYRDVVVQELKQHLNNGKEENYMIKVLHGDGDERVLQVKAFPVKRNGETIGGMALAEEVTEKLRVEMELQRSNDILHRVREELVAAYQQQQQAVEEELRAQLEEAEINKNALAEAHQRLQTIIDFLPDPAFVINRQGKVELWNHAMEDLTGIKARDILGRGNYEYAVPFYGRRVPMLIDAAMNPQLIQEYNMVVDAKENDTIFAEIYCPQLGVQGSYLSCKSAPLLDRDGNLAGAIEIMRDVTERKKVEKALYESEQKYRNMIENIDDGYFEVDLEGNFQFVNRYLCERVAYRTGELLGKNFRTMMDEENAERVRKTFHLAYKTGKTIRDAEWYVRHRDGSQIAVESTVIPIKENDEVIGFRGIVRDITARKKAELALQASEKNLRQQVEYLNTLIDNLHEMFFTFDRNGHITFVNKRSYDVLGYGPDEIIGCHVADFVRPDVRDRIYQGVRARLGKRSRDTYEVPIIHKNGSERIIKLNTSSLLGDGDKIIGGMVLAEDITERKLAQQALEISEAQYRAIVEDQTELICRSHPDGRIIFVNEAYCRYFNQKREEVLEKNFNLPIHPEDRTWVMQQMNSLSPENPSCTLEYRVVLCDGDIRWQQWTHRAIFDGFGNLVNYQSVGRDITEQKAAQEKLTYLSQRDPLTGLYNRRYFEEALKRYESSSNPVGLIMCDVDGLKLVNDTLGHEQGDRLLRVISDLMKSCFRGDDILARVGGDEFAAIVPNASPGLLEERIQAIFNKVKDYNLEHRDFPISISLGYAVRRHPQVPILQVFKEADDNMYRKKLDSGGSVRSTMVHTLVKALEVKDDISAGHAERLQLWLELMARELGLSDRTINDLRLLAQFHDIGKVGIPDSVLFKEGELTEEEQRLLQRHCEIGHRIALSVPELVLISDWILKHHEWWNGEGYPLGLKREEIPLECRIMAIADAYDTMTHRRALSREEAVQELRNKAGSQFDPNLVELFAKILESHKTG